MTSAEIKKKFGIDVKFVKDMPDYSDDPFFKKMKERALEFLEKYPLPPNPKKKK